jgi:threonyl-tRNA synthetase
LKYYFVAQQVFWHSTAHVLGEAMERVYGGMLCYGPPIENGFYYDMFIEDKQVRRHIFSIWIFYNKMIL